MGGERAEAEDVEQVSSCFDSPRGILHTHPASHSSTPLHTHPRLIPPHPFRSLLEAEGYAVFGLTGAEDGELYRDAVVRMYIPAMPLPYHCFSRVSPPIRLMDRTVRSIRSTRSV